MKKDALHTHIPVMTANYNRLRRLFDVPVNCDIIAVETTVFGIKYEAKAPGGMMHLLRKNFYFWASGGNLYIIPTEEHLSPQHITASTLSKDLMRVLNDTDIPLYMIHRNDIQYFKLSGQKRAETNIKSINNGTNVSGAIVGGLLAGDAGAVIGSQHNKGQIISYTSHYDDRLVELYYTQRGSTLKLKLSVSAYPLLEKWFPDKEFEFVNSRSNIQPTSDKFAELREYKNLLDGGIITQGEFDAKKKELLQL